MLRRQTDAVDRQHCADTGEFLQDLRLPLRALAVRDPDSEEVNRVNTILRLTGLGIWQLNAQWEYVERHREVKPLLRRGLVALSAVLAETRPHAGILITINEVSSGKVRLRELSRFALEVSHAIAEGANVMIVFAGIKVDLEALVEQERTTFLRRSRELDFRRRGGEARRSGGPRYSGAELS